MRKIKLNDYCAFPMVLDMFPYTVEGLSDLETDQRKYPNFTLKITNLRFRNNRCTKRTIKLRYTKLDRYTPESGPTRNKITKSL